MEGRRRAAVLTKENGGERARERGQEVEKKVGRRVV